MQILQSNCTNLHENTITSRHYKATDQVPLFSLKINLGLYYQLGKRKYLRRLHPSQVKQGIIPLNFRKNNRQ